MTARKPREMPPPKSGTAISSHADHWIRQFIWHFESHVVGASCDLPVDAGISEWQAAAARAVLKSFLDSGMELESALEMIGRAAIEGLTPGVAWTDAMNERRFALIDREIQGTLAPAERIELAGLTRIMREEVDSESNLPMEGARALHRRLLHLEPMGEPN